MPTVREQLEAKYGSQEQRQNESVGYFLKNCYSDSEFENYTNFEIGERFFERNSTLRNLSDGDLFQYLVSNTSCNSTQNHQATAQDKSKDWAQIGEISALIILGILMTFIFWKTGQLLVKGYKKLSRWLDKD